MSKDRLNGQLQSKGQRASSLQALSSSFSVIFTQLLARDTYILYQGRDIVGRGSHDWVRVF